jgi:16S rRNA (cytidine1402-2'-O)-methyltransferase
MLYIVATPIGNMEDITFRAVRILQEVDFIFCEDTRVSRKILERYDIKDKKLISYHQHTKDKKLNDLLDLVESNKVALICDAGTPGISDPGNFLIQELLKKYPEVNVETIPGPSAVLALLSVSGFPADRFVFKGFVPHKKGRQKFLKEVLQEKETVVFYESCHRVFKTLDQLNLFVQEFGIDKKMVVGRELTKKFETIYRGSVREVLEQLKKEFPSDKVKGEIVMAIA